MKIVTVNGCFDILHTGHLDLLEFAKNQGDKLIVLLNSDEAVRKLKGPSRPINKLKDRVRMLKAIRCVDDVIIIGDTPLQALSIVKPSVHVKSKDADPEKVKAEKLIVEAYGGQVIYFNPNNKKSVTKLLKKMNA